MTRTPTIFYFGHHKCATRWLVDILVDVCGRVGYTFYEAHNPGMFGDDLHAFIERNPVNVLAYTNARFEWVGGIEDVRGFHVIRDPRDILVSAYFSHMFSHSTDGWPALVEHRRAIQGCNEERGLEMEMDFIEDVFQALSSWKYDLPGVLELKMESLCREPYEGLVGIFQYLGLVSREEDAIDDEIRRALSREPHCEGDTGRDGRSGSAHIELFELLRIVYHHRFSKKAGGRNVGEEDPQSHYRRGQAGDWRNHFTPKLKEEFWDRHGKLLLATGYETNDRWVMKDD